MKEGSLIHEEIHRADQSEGNLDSIEGSERRSFRMAANALRRAKSVVFGFLLVCEKIQGAVTFEEGYQCVIWAKKVIRKPDAERENYFF